MSLASYLSTRTQKLILIIALLTSAIFITNKLYIWINTESTDNAYLEADITFVSPEISGIITDVMVKDHHVVKAGQILARIDQATYHAKLATAQSAASVAKQEATVASLQLSIAHSKLAQAQQLSNFAKINQNLTQKELHRAERLAKQNFSSKQNLDSVKKAAAKSAAELAKSTLAVNIASENVKLQRAMYQAKMLAVTVAENQLQLAQIAFDNTFLRAPIAGIIGNTQLRIGSFARPGMPLLAITPKKDVYVKANFKETQIRHLKAGQKVTVILDSIKSQSLPGTIRTIAPATGAKFSLIPPDNATGNFTKVVQRVPVIIDIEIPDNLKQYAPIGASASVHIPF